MCYMIPYASNTGTTRNLDTLRDAGWRILVGPAKPKLPQGFRYALDNGAYGYWQSGLPFDGDRFSNLVAAYGDRAEFIVIPDIVAEGKKSLEFSRQWLPSLPRRTLLLLAVQDGMTADDVGAFIRNYSNTGIFLGGSTEWKLKTLYGWGMVAHSLGCYYHVGRVNTSKRIRLCAEAGAHSFDGTSVSRYSCNMPKLDNARNHASLLTPAMTETFI